jgi:hypothetical protein
MGLLKIMELEKNETPNHGPTSVAVERFPSGNLGTFIPGLTSGAFYRSTWRLSTGGSG